MANPTYPGVYVEEVSSGVRPIEAVGTSTCIFVGQAERGGSMPRKLTSWSEYLKFFGGFYPGSYMAESVYQFFCNGGSVCYVLRVLKQSGSQIASVQVKNRIDGTGVTFTAKNQGDWGNFLYLQIEDGTENPVNELKISVRKQVEAALEPEDNSMIVPLEVFDNLSMNPDAANNAETVINNRSNLIHVKCDADENALGPGKHYGAIGITLTGGTDVASDDGLKDMRKFLINIDYDGWLEVKIPKPGEAPDDDAVIDDAETDLTKLRDAIKDAVRRLAAKKKHQTTPDAAYEGFECTLEPVGNEYTEIEKVKFQTLIYNVISDVDKAFIDEIYEINDAETKYVLQLSDDADTAAEQRERLEGIFDNIRYLVFTSGTAETYNSSVQIRGYGDPAQDAIGLLKIGPENGGKSVDAHAALMPKNFAVLQIGDAIPGGDILAANPGSDGTGEPISFMAAYPKLDNITDASLLAVPGIGIPGVISEAMGYCNNRKLQDLFFIGDVSRDMPDPVANAVDFRTKVTSPNTYGAIYLPWIMAQDPSGRSSELVALPPSGFIAGLYSRIDARRGVWKAPAGTEAILNNSMGLTVNLTDTEQGQLNPKSVNCIRQFPQAGIVSWGARTIFSDPEYKYIPVRRLAIMLRVSIYNGIQWAVFEPNDESLWAQLRMNIKSFMMTLFRRGAFQGMTPQEAFLVKCDRETTTQDDINLGIVNIIIAFAPLKPAEFVIVKITQKAGQSS